MSSELVRPGEPPATVLPLADVGLLPGVGPQVGLEVAGLGVGLPTPGVVAGVAGTLPLLMHLRMVGLIIFIIESANPPSGCACEGPMQINESNENQWQ